MWVVGEGGAIAPDPEAGFTLLEALVVMAVLTLAVGIGFPAVDAAQRFQTFSDGAARFEAALRGARAQALRRSVAVPFSISVDRKSFSSGAASERLGDRVLAEPGGGRVIFYPDGTASGGEVRVEDGSRTRRWKVRPTTGLIERVS